MIQKLNHIYNTQYGVKTKFAFFLLKKTYINNQVIKTTYKHHQHLNQINIKTCENFLNFKGKDKLS